MKRIKALFLAFLLAFTGGNIFASGYPVFDVSKWLQGIDDLYAYYQQITQMIEQVQQNYKKIEQAAKQMQSFNYEEMGEKLKKNFEDVSSNPFEAITGVHKSAHDIVGACESQMNRVNEITDTLNKKNLEFCGMKVSIADLCGAGDKDKDVVDFVKNAWNSTTDKENGPFAQTIKAFVGNATPQERFAIMKKFGMSPENYASLELARYQAKQLMKDANITSTIEYQIAELEHVENDANALQMMAQNLGEEGEGSVFAASQLACSGLANMQRLLGRILVTMDKSVGLQSELEYTRRCEEAIMQQQEKENIEAAKELETKTPDLDDPLYSD